MVRRVPFLWLQRLDVIGHKLHIPRRLRRSVCDEYERRLQESFDWGYHNVATTAYLDAANLNYTAGTSQTINVTQRRKRHDA